MRDELAVQCNPYESVVEVATLAVLLKPADLGPRITAHGNHSLADSSQESEMRRWGSPGRKSRQPVTPSAEVKSFTENLKHLAHFAEPRVIVGRGAGVMLRQLHLLEASSDTSSQRPWPWISFARRSQCLRAGRLSGNGGS